MQRKHHVKMNKKTRKFYSMFDLVKITLVWTGISFCDVILIHFQVFAPAWKKKKATEHIKILMNQNGGPLVLL